MKRALTVIAILVFATAFSNTHVYAQMMGENQSTMSMMKPQASKQMADLTFDNLVTNSTTMSSTMMKDFNQLQNRFQMVMKSDDMQQWKSDMQKMQTMMQKIHKEMSQEMEMHQRMMSMMQNGEMPGHQMGQSSMGQSNMGHSGMMGANNTYDDKQTDSKQN